MAYRFVLEVEESHAEEVNTAITTVPDAQVLLMRNSHGLGFNDPFMDLSIAAYSFAVIERVYRWIADYGEPYPEVRLVLHDGRRVSLTKAGASLTIAAVRRDQPWVDYTMPMIGSHEPGGWPDTGRSIVQASPAAIHLDEPESLVRRLETAPVVLVHNLDSAERFYAEVLDLHVVARARRDDQGLLQAITGDYDPKLARLSVNEADVVFLENGPLQLNLERFPRGLPLPYGTDPRRIEAGATPEQINVIKGRILMNGYNLLESDANTLRFADPFNAVWTIASTAVTDTAEPTALQG